MSEVFISGIEKLIQKIEQTQMDNINKAGQIIADAVASDHYVYVFGTGQSALMMYETMNRKGVFAQIIPMLDMGVAMNSGARASGGFEKLAGYGRIVVNDYLVQPGDVLIDVSNSGVNATPVEVAIEAKKKGMTVVALISMDTARHLPPDKGNPYGKNLYEVADLVLDTCGVAGDALVQLEGMVPKVGPDSTILNAIVLHAVLVEADKDLLAKGITPAIGMRVYDEGGPEYNARVVDPVRRKMRALNPHF